MENSIYQINKNINKPIEFRGLKAQYIWHLGGALVGLMIIYSVLYIIGVNSYICLAIIIPSGAGSIAYVYKLSNKYGQYGMMKKLASARVPKVIKCRSRKIFFRPPTRRATT